MKISPNNNRRVLTVGLAIMLATLIAFSMLPLVSSVIQASQGGNAALSKAAGPSSAELSSTVLASQVTGYELVLQREPDNINAWRGLLETQLRQGNIEAAIAPLQKLTQLDPQALDYGLLLAQTQQYLKNETGAIATYQELLITHPQNIQVLKGLADLYLAQKRPEDAIQLAQKNLAQALTQKQLQAKKSNDSSISEAANETAHETATTVASLQLLLGEIYGQQNRNQDAIAIYDQASQENPQDFRPTLAKALLLQKQGKTREAEPLFTSAIRLAPAQYKDELKKLATQPSPPQAQPPG
jgi:tetratricopeptide (TPR) repeat protein